MLTRTLGRWLRPWVEARPRLAMALRCYRDSAHLDRELVTTPLGFRFVGHPQMERGLFEPLEAALISKLLNQSDVFINVGANMGYYCCLALSRACTVVAVEPIPANLQILYRNLLANAGASHLEVHPVALGASVGLVEIYGGGTAASLLQGWAGASPAHRQTVPMTSLDRIVGDRFSDRRQLILIDVEGAELGVLRGALRLLGRSPKPTWFVEVSIDEHQPQGRSLNPDLVPVFELFEEGGYGAWVVADQIRRLDYSTIREVATTRRNTLAGHNFVFADPSLRVEL